MTDLAKQDPALAEALCEGDEEELALIARFSDESDLSGQFHGQVRIVSRFGDIATLRVKRDALEAFVALPEVSEVEISRPVAAPLKPDQSQIDEGWIGVAEEQSGYTRRPDGLGHRGAGTVVGVLDWGLDFAFPTFRTESGRTRLLALWDQRQATGGRASSSPGAPPNRWGYGRIFSREVIDEALTGSDPFTRLDYHPGDADSRSRSGAWKGSHGTHVLDIAAGNGRGGGLSGVAPEAELVFVHLSRTADVLGAENLGDSASLLEAIDFVFAVAGERPCVINMSVGAHGGPHDGTTLVERGIDQAVWTQDGRAIVNSAGNYFAARAHAFARLSQGAEHDLDFEVPANDYTNSEVEIYYEASDRFIAEIYAPNGTLLGRVAPGEEVTLEFEGRRIGRVYHHARERGNGDKHIDVFIYRFAPGGHWRVRLLGTQVVDGRFHAWIERDRGPRPRFISSDTVLSHTTGTLCNGLYSITVGAYDPHGTDRALGLFSSSGPTRDGRQKPEVIAPGVEISAAQSTPPGGEPAARFTRKSGTSMAAPHVTGTIALMFEAAARPMPITETRARLFASLEKPHAAYLQSQSTTIHRAGFGWLDIASAVAIAELRDNAEVTEEELDVESECIGFQEDGQIAMDVSDLLAEEGEKPAANEGGVEQADMRTELAEELNRIPDSHPEIRSDSLLLDVAGIILRQLQRGSVEDSDGSNRSYQPLDLGEEVLQVGDVFVRERPAEGIHYTGVITGLEPQPESGDLRASLVEVPYPGAAIRRAQRSLDGKAKRKGDAFYRIREAEGIGH